MVTRSVVKVARQLAIEAAESGDPSIMLQALLRIQDMLVRKPPVIPTRHVTDAVRALSRANQPARDRDGLIHGLTWVDDLRGRFYFRWASFEAHTEGAIPDRLAQAAIRRLGGNRAFLNIHGEGITCWWVPVELLTPPDTGTISVAD